MVRDSSQVQSVTRAFALLDALERAQDPLALADLTAESELAAPTVHRLLQTLCELGVARQLPDRRYALGPTLIGLGERARPKLADRAQATLARLEDAMQETANLAVLYDDLVTYVAQVPSRHHMRMFTEVGRRVLPHASGVGKAMLASLPEQQVRDLVGRTGMPSYTPTTLTDVDALLTTLQRARQRGFAIDDGEQEVGVRCISVALPASDPPAAVSISGPAARITDDVVARAVDALTAAAAELARS